MRRLAALVVLPLALGAPARRHAAQQDDTDVLKPSYATCHEPKMKEVCPAYNTIMYMYRMRMNHMNDVQTNIHEQKCKVNTSIDFTHYAYAEYKAGHGVDA